MTGLRVVMVVLSVLHLGWSCLPALTAAFADGGSVPERLLLSVVHPVAALLLAYVLVSSAEPGLRLWRITMTMLPVSIGGDIVMAVLIGQGVLRGDWPLPLTFVVIPVICFPYIIWRRKAGLADAT